MTKTRPLHRLAWIVGLLASSTPSVAAAHFILEEPENWVEQSGLGDPQKTGPCGDEAPTRPTGAITAYQTGQTITIRIDETIFHPGHFRVALVTDDRSDLPPMPTVTPDSRSDCGSIPIMDPPVFPVLADGLLPHTSPLTGIQEMEVTLPEGVTCDRCTLQIVQWMAEHAAPCFYYHCADLSISDVVVDSGPPAADAAVSSEVDAASSSEIDAATTTGTDSGARMDSGANRDAGLSASSSGCACATRSSRAGEARAATVLALIALGLVARRRRRVG